MVLTDNQVQTLHLLAFLHQTWYNAIRHAEHLPPTDELTIMLLRMADIAKMRFQVIVGLFPSSCSLTDLNATSPAQYILTAIQH